ncbi:MAG: class I SAM-dependent RNA methyltransferase [Bacillota bacterium]|nr:class I SAM-dependent RNA methyltransferase [Bacillota bacterium]
MKKMYLTIPTLLGTEQVVAFEVEQLGYEVTEVVDGNVTFIGDEEAICLANINLRAAERVMVKLAQFQATTFDMLFEGVKAIPWENYIQKDGAFPVNGHSLKSALHSIPDCQSIIKKAVVTRMSQIYGISHFEEIGAYYPIKFAIMKDIVTMYIDTTGDNLYKRGYRVESVIAPMRETLAFAMISLSFWKGDRPFMDPFCGSGTIPIEAAMFAVNRAPGIKRRFVAETWRNIIPKEMWKDAREEAIANENHDIPIIYASDIDPHAIEIAQNNARNAGVLDKIKFSVTDVAKVRPFTERGVVCCNPPYGERLMDAKSCESLYRTMGKKFSEFTEAKKLILTSHEQFEKFYGREADKRRKLYNGMLKCYVYQYFK